METKVFFVIEMLQDLEIGLASVKLPKSSQAAIIGIT